MDDGGQIFLDASAGTGLAQNLWRERHRARRDGNFLLALGRTRGNDKVDEQHGRYGHAEDKTE